MGFESKIDVIADKLNSGFKEKLPRDIEINGLEKNTNLSILAEAS